MYINKCVSSNSVERYLEYLTDSSSEGKSELLQIARAAPVAFIRALWGRYRHAAPPLPLIRGHGSALATRETRDLRLKLGAGSE